LAVRNQDPGSEEEFESEWWYSHELLRTMFYPLLYLTSWRFRLWDFLRKPPEVRRKKAEAEAKKIRARYDFPRTSIADLAGRDKEFRQVMLSIQYHVLRDKEVRRIATAPPPKLFVIKGSSGTGKTVFAEALMRWAFEEGLMYGLLVEYNSLKPEQVYTMWYGQSAARLSSFFESSFMRPSVVLVDEFQAYGRKVAASTEVGMEETRVQTVFLEKIDELLKRPYRTILFVSTTEYETLLEPIRRRGVLGTIDLDVGLSKDMLVKIATAECQKHKISLSPRAVVDALEDVLRSMGGSALTPADVVNAFSIVVHEKMQLLAGSVQQGGLGTAPPNVGQSVSIDDFRAAARSLKTYVEQERTEAAKRAALRVRPKETYRDVGGLKGIKEEVIKELSLALNPDLAIKARYVSPKGFVFQGPPGTGKTLLAKAIAHENKGWFYGINGPSILQGMYGDPEKTIRNIFDDARKHSPALIFFDEIDSIAPRRGSADPVIDRVTSQLLTEIDGFVPLSGVVVIAGTNRLEAMDPALLERFTHRFEFTYPKDVSERTDIVAIHLSQYTDICAGEVTPESVLEVFAGKVLSPRRIADVINQSNRLRAKELDGARMLLSAKEEGEDELKEVMMIYSQEETRLSEILGLPKGTEEFAHALSKISPENYPLRLYHFRKALEMTSEESTEEARKMIESTVRLQVPEVGKVYGLMAFGESGLGGAIAAIEVQANRRGSGKVKVLGSEVGESVQASAEDAFVFLNSVSGWRFKDWDFYVELVTPAKGLERIPSGIGTTSPPISGPSAGMAIAIAMLSAVLGLRPDPHTVATGAITAKGEVWPVGGLDYRGMGKIEATLSDRFAKKLLLPKYNLDRLAEGGGLDPLTRAGVSAVGVETVLDAAVQSLMGVRDKDHLLRLLGHSRST
jgi:SpoVK/Ycf46/Vps4 family AAA+-type ATPase